jgi:hypothetical protein
LRYTRPPQQQALAAIGAALGCGRRGRRPRTGLLVFVAVVFSCVFRPSSPVSPGVDPARGPRKYKTEAQRSGFGFERRTCRKRQRRPNREPQSCMALFDDAALTKGVSKGGTSPPAGPCLFANSVNWQLGIPLWRPLWRPTPFLPRRRNGVGILFKFPFICLYGGGFFSAGRSAFQGRKAVFCPSVRSGKPLRRRQVRQLPPVCPQPLPMEPRR